MPARLDALLLGRATFGYAGKDAHELSVRGHDDWLDWQLHPLQVDDSALDQRLAEWPWIDWTPYEAHADPQLTDGARANHYRGIRLIRAVESRRQLFERVVEFWTDHFNVPMGSTLRLFDDRAVWRSHALGSFRDLLGAVMHAASMLAYLDSNTNVASGPNENLSREMLELHTLGVTGPYAETDVREFARCLTGWTFVEDPTDPTYGSFAFNAAVHDFAPKTVLGVDFDGTGGEAEVETILDLVANHPATIEFVTRKLAHWLLGDEPPAFAVADAIDTWSSTGGDMREVIRTLLSRRAIRALHRQEITKLRRPFDWLAASLRAAGLRTPVPLESSTILKRLGQSPFGWPAPDGYPDTRAHWGGLLQPRWEIAASLARPAQGLDAWAHDLSNVAATVGTLPRPLWAGAMNQQLTGGTLSPTDAIDLKNFVAALSAEPDEVVLSEAFEMLLTAPSFQTV